MMDLRHGRKEKGLCVQCGAKLDREGIYCIRCNDMNNITKSFIMQELHENNKCTDCGKPLDREGWFCLKCVRKSNAKARERNMRRREKGLCIQCGNPAEDDRSYCRRCLDILKERRLKKVNKNV
jgi:predicted amidophosphoribosyltransferase